MDEPWISMILSGAKTWEMRSRPTSLRGRIALIRKRSGLVVGTAELVDCLAPLDADAMAATADRHGIDPGWQPDALAAGWVIPWVLRDARALAAPVPYRHPLGAVGWVVLDQSATEAIAGRVPLPLAAVGTARDRHADASASATSVAEIVRPAGPPARPLPAIGAGESGVVRLTGGNIRNGHVYLRAVRYLLPDDVIGGPNAEAAAPSLLTVTFEPGPTITTDVAGDKMILRQRGPVREFFRAAGAREGEDVVVQRTGPYSLRIALLRVAR
ncbi:ASCH domain-containing protein [Roseicella aquatilis]|uniref:ASCH domain-containing protein n=1 Tax=Roseicella aquatilis TaxID=2527868 RepID=UPI0014046AC5|nr:ASCH domain-containing protein [Roseicella aquatilis]